VGLLEVAESENAQLIVVGPSHRSGLGLVRPGSVGELLLSGAPVPVAIAPRGYADSPAWLGLIACAFDGSPESRLALDWATQLADSNRSRLRVISVLKPVVYGAVGFDTATVDPIRRRDLVHEQQTAIAGYDGPVELLLRDGDPAWRLAEASREADLLVMGSRGYGPLQATLLGGVSHHVLHHAACPVVIHPRSALHETDPQLSPPRRLPEPAAVESSPSEEAIQTCDSAAIGDGG
jgi:nucleotide-binding universal stress UspA family protein